MAPRPTRGAALPTREAASAFVSSASHDQQPQQLSSPPATPAANRTKKIATPKPAVNRASKEVKNEIDFTLGSSPPPTPAPKAEGKKRTHVLAKKADDGDDVSAIAKSLETTTADEKGGVNQEGGQQRVAPLKKKRATKVKEVDVAAEIIPPAPTTGRKKGKRAVPKIEYDVNALPHNLGTAAVDTNVEDGLTQSEIQKEAPAKKRTSNNAKEAADVIEITPSTSTPKGAGKKRKRATVSLDESTNSLPPETAAVPPKLKNEAANEEAQEGTSAKKRRGLKAAIAKQVELVEQIVADGIKDEETKSGAKRSSRRVAAKKEADPAPEGVGDKASLSDSPPKKRRGRKSSIQAVKPELGEIVDKAPAVGTSPEEKHWKKVKKVPYGLTPGITPFPEHEHPTPEECKLVNDLLAKVHGEVKPPEKIPEPSLTVTGCGEVPSVLDALIRTRLSAATSAGNSAMAFKGLVQKFGLTDRGIGKGSIDWDKVRLADVNDIKEAIKSGGLENLKSKDIKGLLAMVYEEGQARRDALIAAKNEGAAGPAGAENETNEEKEAEIERAEQNVLSLQHLHLLPSHKAMIEMVKYPGIGVKTASCVLLFCLRRPSFAVDTHVFRLCRWLGWVPAKSNEVTAYMHCEVKVPDELKYPLHQLFIAHGRNCPRCKASTGEGSEGWEEDCPIEHLVTRTGKRKQKPVLPKKGKKSIKATESDEEVERVWLDDVEGEVVVDNEVDEGGAEDEVERTDTAVMLAAPP